MVDLLKFGFDGTIVEVEELVTNTIYMQDVQNSKLYIPILELLTHDTLIY
ncbi:MAG: hypothetical protein K8R25_11160 [Methanosarcinales archaeon]|nr:hypothetical protein [Methanosarcinales archaeon]